jgi:hypothetical protein
VVKTDSPQTGDLFAQYLQFAHSATTDGHLGARAHGIQGDDAAYTPAGSGHDDNAIIQSKAF